MGKRSKKKKRPAPPPPRRSRGLRYLVVSAVALAALSGIWIAWENFVGSGGRWQSIPHGAFKGHNLLLITIDTLRADRLGCYGSPAGLSPNIDRLAAEGIRFEDVLAHVPLTLPAHTSIFTSMYPTEHGVHDNGTFRVEPSLTTLPTLLKQAGYHTGAFVGAFVLDARFGLNRGFDVYDDYYGEKRAFLSFSQLERRAEEVIAPAERWITESASTPWFAWVHVFDPHTPYEAPPDFQSRFPDDKYGAEVAYTDEVVGSFVERLRTAGGLRQTIVMILGDHGESLGEHGERTHGTFAYSSTLRVPWLVWAESGIRPQAFSGTVRHVDLMPTVLDLLGVPPLEGTIGQSLLPYLNGERRYEPPVTYFEALNVHLTRDWAPLRGVVRDRYKLISLPIPELYDLERDPDEEHNIYREEPELSRELEKVLEDISAGGNVGEVNLPDLETIQRLQALGYITAPVQERKTEYTEEDDPKRLIDVSNAFEEAKDLFVKGRPEDAIVILQDVLRKQPQSSHAYQALAYALYQAGRLGEAIEVLEQGVENGVQEMSLLGLLSAYLLDAGRIDQARGLLEDLVRREPDFAEGHNYLGIAYGRLGLQDDARREFEKVLELDPSSASTYNNLGSLALSRGDLPEAVRLLNQALEFDPELASAHNGLGVAYARTGDIPAAIESWRRTVELNPRQFDALYNLAVALADRSPSEAIPYLKRFASEAPPHRYEADIAKVRAMIRTLEKSASP